MPIQSQVLGNTAPSWLRVPELRRRGVFVSNLSAHVTTGKLESTLMAEADCNITELFRVMDPVVGFSGVMWVLFDDEISVERVLGLFNSGGANIYGSAFDVSTVNTTLEGEPGAEAAAASAAVRRRGSAVARSSIRALSDISMREEERQHELARSHAEIRELEASRKQREDAQSGRHVCEDGAFW